MTQCLAFSMAMVVFFGQSPNVMADTPSTTEQIIECTGPVTKARKATTPTLKSIVNAVKKAYGDSYIPNTKIDAKTLSEQYGIKKSMYDSVYAEGPMLSFQIDTFIVVKAKKGKVATVKKALNNYKKYLLKESMQYPMNAAKLPAAQVYSFGNYVVFSMLVTPEHSKAQTETQILKEAKAQNKIAYDTIKKLFK